MEVLNQSPRINPVKLLILLVIAVIAIITIAASFFSARKVAADRVTLADVYLIQTFLKAYKDNQGYYPPSNGKQPVGWQDYLQELPMQTGLCPGDYIYKVLNDGTNYSLNFCLNRSSNGFKPGLNQVGPGNFKG